MVYNNYDKNKVNKNLINFKDLFIIICGIKSNNIKLGGRNGFF